MSLSSRKAADVANAYSCRLERQILHRGSSLACRDEELCAQAEGLLGEGAAREAHCLGLDPLLEMEASLEASAASTGRPRARGGLQGLAKAFEVVEQAALNLYLGPWRKEYRLVKMYSGTFTHFIKPVLSERQVEKLFGLLGYRLSSRHQQLRLQPPGVAHGSLGELLRLACAFFLARCECRLLLAALGRRAGETQWELSVVRERREGNSLQVAIDNTKRKLGVSEPPFEGEEEVDLYTDEQINGARRARREESALSRPSALKGLSNGVAPPSSSSCSASVPPREDVHVSTLHCQLTNLPPPEQDTPHPVGLEEGQLPRQESALNQQAGGAAPPLAEAGAAVTADGSGQPPEPIPYHRCCEQAPRDPRALCLTCRLFHAGGCGERDSCQRNHRLQPLGVCSCGRACERDPLVLCRYCGSEYCLLCWYRSPVVCACGQTFEQSSV